jgi:hypothetical protein
VGQCSAKSYRFQCADPGNDESPRMGLFTVILTLIGLPATILINRCIITPYSLPTRPTLSNAKLSLRLILTPDEYTKPWTLYIAPGLVASVGIHAVWVTIVARGVKWMLVSYDELGKSSQPYHTLQTELIYRPRSLPRHANFDNPLHHLPHLPTPVRWLSHSP